MLEYPLFEMEIINAFFKLQPDPCVQRRRRGIKI
jgi:hypothetical protein